MNILIRSEDGWESIPVPYADPASGPVWHYTSNAALVGILSEDALWASLPLVLNDVSEIKYGVSVAAEAWAEVRNGDATADGVVATYIDELFVSPESATRSLAESTFVFCASLDDDSLSQWRAYAGSSGVAIGLDMRSRLEPLDPPPSEMPAERDRPAAFGDWFRVLYTPQEQLGSARRLFRFLLSHYTSLTKPENLAINLLPHLATLVATMKHPGFHDEREVRYIVPRSSSLYRERFRPSRFGLVPYLRVGSCRGIDRQPLPITAVKIGPTPYPDVAEIGLRHLLSSVGRDVVEILGSAVPYRS